MSITPEWFLRARNGLGPAIPPAALHAIMGSFAASYHSCHLGSGDGQDGNGLAAGGDIGNGDGMGNGAGNECGIGWGHSIGGGSGGGHGAGDDDDGYGDGHGNGNGRWPDPAVYFEEAE